MTERKFAPATQRNREPILSVLQGVLPQRGLVLEISSGTGEHAIFFAPQLPHLYWLPSDPDPIALESIRAWQQEQPTQTLLPPVSLDVSQPHWSEQVHLHMAQPPLMGVSIAAIVNINMIHISPWRATLGLMAGAEALLPTGGMLYLYGPYKQGGVHTAPSNEAFDDMLRSRNPEWGVRDLEEVIAVAEKHHLTWHRTIEMPANNFSIVFASKT
jgi:SAM-dependent methyltransferase